MDFKDGINEGSGDSLANTFIKLQDGETIKGVFRGQPHDFKQHFIKADNKSYNCTTQNCSWCAQGDRPKFRFRVNFVVKQPDGTLVAKIFEHGAKFYNKMKSLHKGGYDLTKNAMAVTRNGKGTLTDYSILPVPNGVVSAAAEKALSEVKLNDLSDQKKEKAEDDFSMSMDSHDDIPF